MKKSVLRVFFCVILTFLFSQPIQSKARTETSLRDTSLMSGAVLYVKGGGVSTNCSSWADACDLKIALDKSVAGDQVWVTEGTYNPSSTDRFANFQLKSGVAVYGGFTGIETSLFQRDWLAHPTILSGEIGNSASLTDNTGIIVFANQVDETGVLDGFTIRDGYSPTGFASGLYAYNSFAKFSNLIFLNNTGSQGGAMCFLEGGGSLSNVTFMENSATLGGGGLSISKNNPTLTDVTFIGNTAPEGGGLYSFQSNPSLFRVVFENNTAQQSGGGMYTAYGSPVLSDVTFFYNHQASAGPNIGGGGMYNTHSNPVLDRVAFTGNFAAADGGGMHNIQNNNSILTNVTFSANTAARGSGMMNWDTSLSLIKNVTFVGNVAVADGGAIYNMDSSTMTIHNAIFWANTSPQVNNMGSSALINNSIVLGGCPIVYPGEITCTSLITADPLLGVLSNNGGFMPTHPLQAGSPAIDAGDPTYCPATDQRGFSRSIDGNDDGIARCDIGAFEYLSGFFLRLPLVLR